MEEGLKELLQANLEISKENNNILRKMQRAHRNAMIMRVLYWLAIIVITIGGFYYIQPFFQKFMDMLPDFSQFSNFLPK